MNPHTGNYKIFIVDDHPIVRKGIAGILEDKPRLEVVGYADHVNGAVAAAEAGGIDLMLVDLSLKDSDGLELIKVLNERFPEIKTLVLSMHGSPGIVEKAMKLGAMGFVHKEDADLCIVQAINQVLSGGTFIPASSGDKTIENHGFDDESLQLLFKLLSDREKEVFSLVSQGKSNTEIAAFLSISIRTVEAHKENLKEKLRLKSNQALTIFAIRMFGNKIERR